jgi:hypothetical protein
MMWTLSPLVLVAFLFTFVTSITASPVVYKASTGNTFSVPLIHNADLPRHGPSEILKTLKKYNLEIPEGLQDAVNMHHTKIALLAAPGDGKGLVPFELSPVIVLTGVGKDNGTVPASSKDGDLLWLAPVTIGTPPQKLFVDLDTGSTDR